MSAVTVRTVGATPISDDDKKIGWVDRPPIVDVRHEGADNFTIDTGDLTGFLYVDRGDDTIAAYPPGHWFGAVLEPDENKE